MLFFFLCCYPFWDPNKHAKKKRENIKNWKKNIEENKKIYQWGEHGECLENYQRLVEEDQNTQEWKI